MNIENHTRASANIRLAIEALQVIVETLVDVNNGKNNFAARDMATKIDDRFRVVAKILGYEVKRVDAE